MSVPKKEVDFLARPPSQAQAVVVALRFAGGGSGNVGTPERETRWPPQAQAAVVALVVAFRLLAGREEGSVEFPWGPCINPPFSTYRSCT